MAAIPKGDGPCDARQVGIGDHEGRRGGKVGDYSGRRELFDGRGPSVTVLVTGNKYPNIEGIRRPFGQFSPKLPLLTVYTGLQWMSYL